MGTLYALVRRNIKLFFKDRGLFFVAMITPLIMLLLFTTFLGSVYKDSFNSIIEGFGAAIDSDLTDAAVVVYLFSALISVSCVTVAFCCNVMSVQDKVNGIREDFSITPVKAPVIAFSYLISTFITSLLICLIAFAIVLGITTIMGQFYFTLPNILNCIGDIALLCFFGSVLSSVICHFCSTQSQISGISGIISSCYGFICGAYMPISQFASGVRDIISALPCTFGTSLLKNHLMSGYLSEMVNKGLPAEGADIVRTSFDMQITLFDKTISIETMYLAIGGTILALVLIFLFLNFKKHKK